MNPLLAKALAKTQAAQAVQAAPEPAQEPAPAHPNLNELLQVVASLKDALLEENPQMEMYMTIIHKKLVEYPELVHLLTDDQIATVYKAALKQSNTTLVKVKEAKAKTAKKEQLALGQDW